MSLFSALQATAKITQTAVESHGFTNARDEFFGQGPATVKKRIVNYTRASFRYAPKLVKLNSGSKKKSWANINLIREGFEIGRRGTLRRRYLKMV